VARYRSVPATRVFSRILLMLAIALVVGGAAFLITWDIPPPSATVEIVLPDDRFPQ
jgi:hypothetical protein